MSARDANVAQVDVQQAAHLYLAALGGIRLADPTGSTSGASAIGNDVGLDNDHKARLEVKSVLQFSDSDCDDLLGELSILNRPIIITRFSNRSAQTKEELRLSPSQLAATFKASKADQKDKLPLWKLGSFGDLRTQKNCLRHDTNVLSVTGVEADYDAGIITPVEAERRLKDANIAALIYTTPSHGEKGNRWRVIAFFDVPLRPDERERHMARLNGIFDGELDAASFVLSQSYYAGSVEGKPPTELWLVDGRPINRADELDALALPKDAKRTAGLESRRVDTSGSGALFALACRVKREGGSLSDFSAALRANLQAAAHVAKEEKTSPGRGQRAINRAWAAAEAQTDFDDRFDEEGPEGQAEQPGAIDLSENGLVEAFRDKFRDELRFDFHQESWFVWNGNRWEQNATQLAHEHARQLAKRLSAVDPKHPEVKALKRVRTWEAVERGSRRIAPFAVTSRIWDSDPWLLGTPGGTLDLRTGELEPSLPTDFITRQTAATPIPLAEFYAPRDCPEWLKFLAFALSNDEGAIRLLQQYFGYSLTGDTREQSLLFVYGPGGSGKGTAVNTFADIMGDYSINVDMSTLTASKHEGHSTQFARMRGARMARASETEEGKAWAEARIKSLTGGDKVTARFMRQDDFEFVPQFKLTIFGNNRPAIQNVDEAMKRRINVLPFMQIPAEKDLLLSSKLRAEWPGILSWAVQGCLDWQRNGLTRPSVVLDATASYFQEQDTFGLWLEQHCEFDEDCCETTEKLWYSWDNYARSVGEPSGSRNKTFPEQLQRRGFSSAKNVGTKRGRGFKGLRLREQDDSFEDL